MIDIESIINIYINPELEKRKTNNTLPANFVLNECLIKLPKESSPLVEFNDEIYWKILATKSIPVQKEQNESVYLHEIKEIKRVYPPKINDIRVDFIYLFSEEGSYWKVLFEFRNDLNEKLKLSYEPDDEWYFSDIIAEILNYKFKKLIIRDTQYSKIGLWYIPSLMPYPLSLISKYLSENNEEEAKKIFIEHCNNNFLENRMNDWWNIEAFNNRKKLFLGAFDLYKNENYDLCLYALINHIEGIISDYLFSNNSLSVSKMPDKIKFFKTSTSSKIDTVHNFVEGSIKEIITDKMLMRFKKWDDTIDIDFPNRHSLSHGKYVKEMFTKENVIKTFLLFDTIYSMIIEYEEEQKLLNSLTK